MNEHVLAQSLVGMADILVFLAFIAAVLLVGFVKSGNKGHKEQTSEDYFLAGRGLSWWLVGFSLIAANISTEQFVGMSGQAADWLGMAIASYEWMAAITLVVVAFVFLPKFLKCGIYTIPQFLEYRYSPLARWVMALATLVILVGVPTASVIYSGAKVICVNFDGVTLGGLNFGDITTGCWIIGILSAVYVFVGGLKACAWADLLQGSALVIGGVIIAVLAFGALGKMDANELIKTSVNPSVTVEQLENATPMERFTALNKADLPDGKLHMVRGKEDPSIPWTALVIGLWIPNFFYWGLNQYIMQRTLGSQSLAEGQKGVVFAAFLKLIIPFVVVIPGILAYNLFSNDLHDEAIKKNSTIIAEYEAGTEKVFLFNEAFAKLKPETATQLLVYNAGLLGSDAPAAVDAESLFAANAEQAKVAAEKNMLVSTTLVGYDYDAAFPTLIKKLLPVGNGLKGFVLAAIFGAVVSSLASMLNSASTIFAMDVFTKMNKNASQKALIMVGRICVVVFVLIAMIIAPMLGRPEFGGIFTFIQEFQGFLSPGILAIFIFGLLVAKTPKFAGTVGILLNVLLYGLFKFSPSIPVLKTIPLLNTIAGMAFLNRMALCFGICLAVLAILTILWPLKEPVQMPVNEKMDIRGSAGAKFWGIAVCVMTVLLYIIFW
ncbi:MAG: sodium/solute symporter [Sedimentisphaerales bacterium]|nr:sodium/solute symporter [Sedimentisphaerales bacterium]MBN2843678.1 sodium/solute symporter [Sedimentisphaerales bacterium]